jgi:hypothetical protein
MVRVERKTPIQKLDCQRNVCGVGEHRHEVGVEDQQNRSRAFIETV